MQNDERKPDWDFFILKTTPSRLFREWALGGIQEEYINGKWVKARIPENYGFHGHSSISLIKVTEKNYGKQYLEDVKKL